MRTLVPLSILLLLPCVPAEGALGHVVQYFFPSFKAKSAESTAATLAELGIGDHAHDSSKIVNITDSNWEEFWGPQQKGEWIVEFTANPEHCATCELVDLAFNDASYKLASAHPDLHIGRVDCSNEIILSTRFIISKPPTIFHISPATRTVRRLPPHVGRPAEILHFYDKGYWRDAAPWLGSLNPLGEGLVPKLVGFAGIALKGYTRAVDRVPRWLGLLIVGALSSYVMSWLHGQTATAPAASTTTATK